MWIEKQKNGTYKYCEYTKDITGKRRKVTVTLPANDTKSKKIAQEILRSKSNELMLIVDTKATFFELFPKFMEHKKEFCKNSTMYNYECKIREILKTKTDINLKDISAGYLQILLKKLSLNKSASTYNYNLRILTDYIRFLYKNDYLDDINFLKKLDKRKRDIDVKEIKYLELDQIEVILSKLESRKDLHNLITFLINTGLRINECLALTFNDVDTDILSINKIFNKLGEVTPPKTKNSNRKISLNERCLKIIKEQKKIEKNKHLLKGKSFSNDNLIFTNKLTGRINISALYYSLRKLGVDIKLHIFRHTHASLCIDAGIPLDFISMRLGHSNTNITKKIYIHKTKKTQHLEYEAFKNIDFNP